MDGIINIRVFIKMIIGCVCFAIGFNLFLQPNGLNAGGLSGLSMVIVSLLKSGTIGLFTGILNVPLFALAGMKISRKFAVLSLLGMLLSSAFIDLFMHLPLLITEPLIAALYGGVLCGAGLGIVYTTGGSTGGADIIVRLLKRRWRDLPIGVIDSCFDIIVVTLTGLVYGDLHRTLYSGVAVVVSGRIIDAVVYRFDYSKVALVISKEHMAVADAIVNTLGRGATYLKGEGCYSGNEMKVVLTAVKRQQISELKRIVTQVDADAFIIIQEAHQVLGDGFAKYSADGL